MLKKGCIKKKRNKKKIFPIITLECLSNVEKYANLIEGICLKLDLGNFPIVLKIIQRMYLPNMDLIAKKRPNFKFRVNDFILSIDLLVKKLGELLIKKEFLKF